MHSYLQLSYHITDRLLAAGNKKLQERVIFAEIVIEFYKYA